MHLLLSKTVHPLEEDHTRELAKLYAKSSSIEEMMLNGALAGIPEEELKQWKLWHEHLRGEEYSKTQQKLMSKLEMWTKTSSSLAIASAGLAAIFFHGTMLLFFSLLLASLCVCTIPVLSLILESSRNESLKLKLDFAMLECKTSMH